MDDFLDYLGFIAGVAVLLVAVPVQLIANALFYIANKLLPDMGE